MFSQMFVAMKSEMPGGLDGWYKWMAKCLAGDEEQATKRESDLV